VVRQVNSSISNFKTADNALWARSAIITAAMVATYAVLVPYFFPNGGPPQDQFSENLYRAEDFIFSAAHIEVVVTGSSKSARLNKGNLPVNYANLSFAGGTATTGLRLIERLRRFPEVVLIEMNESLLREPDEKLVASTSSNRRLKLLGKIPVFRAKYQPVAILNLVFSRYAGSGNTEIAPNKDAFEKMLNAQLTLPPPSSSMKDWSRIIGELKTSIDLLRSRNTVVVLFDIPVDSRIENSDHSRAIKALLLAAFPQGQYHWIAQPQSSLPTTDGVHLTSDSAEKYVAFLTKQIASIYKPNQSTERQ